MTPVEISNKTSTTKGSIIKEKIFIFILDSDKSHDAQKKIQNFEFRLFLSLWDSLCLRFFWLGVSFQRRLKREPTLIKFTFWRFIKSSKNFGGLQVSKGVRVVNASLSDSSSSKALHVSPLSAL